MGVLDDAVHFQARDSPQLKEAGCQYCHQLFTFHRDTATTRPPEHHRRDVLPPVALLDPPVTTNSAGRPQQLWRGSLH